MNFCTLLCSRFPHLEGKRVGNSKLFLMKLWKLSQIWQKLRGKWGKPLLKLCSQLSTRKSNFFSTQHITNMQNTLSLDVNRMIQIFFYEIRRKVEPGSCFKHLIAGLAIRSLKKFSLEFRRSQNFHFLIILVYVIYSTSLYFLYLVWNEPNILRPIWNLFTVFY